MRSRRETLPKILRIHRGQYFDVGTLDENSLIDFYSKSLKRSPVSSFLIVNEEQAKSSLFMSFYQVTKNMKIVPEVLGPEASFILLINFRFHFRDALVYEGQSTERHYSGEKRKRAIISRLQNAVEQAKDPNLAYLLLVSQLIDNLDFFLFCSRSYSQRENIIQTIEKLLRQLSFRESFKKNLYMLTGMFYEAQGQIAKAIKSYLVSLNFHDNEYMVYLKVSELYAELGSLRLSHFYRNRSLTIANQGGSFEAA